MRKDKKNQHKKHPILIAALLSVLGFFAYWLGKMKPSERQKVVDTAVDATKKVCGGMVSFFVPHECNDYKPRVFHKKSVTNIVVVVLIVKIIVVSSLFAVFPNQAQLNQDVTAQMYEMINQYRIDVGGISLQPNTYLEQVASAKADDMLSNNYFSHYGVDGKKPWEWINTSEYDFKTMGENLAMDFLTANSVLKAFQKSPTHDRNLINEKYAQIGIAVKNGYLDGHNTNIMVVFFGAPKVSAATLIAKEEVLPPQEILPIEQPTTEPVEVHGVEPVLDPIPEPVEKPLPTPVEPVLDPASIPQEEIEPLEQPEIVKVVKSDSEPVEKLVVVERITENTETEVLGESITDNRVVYAENFNAGSIFVQGNWAQRAVKWSDRFLTVALIALVFLLIINIIIKVRVQHAPAIVNGTFLIIVVTVLLTTNIHHAEALGEQVRILGAFLL